MVELIRRLDQRLFRIHVACFHRRGALLARAAERADSISAFSVSGFRRVSALRQLIAFARWCRQVEARVVHACELYANLFALPGATLAGAPVRIGNRRELATADKSAAQLACQRTAYRLAHVVVANSDAASALLRREGVPPHKIRTIANGLDITQFAPPAHRPDVRRILIVANLRPEKGHDLLIDASVRIADRHPAVEFQVAGDGPLRDDLIARAVANGVRDRFHFLGHRNDVPALLAASDLFVLPSRSEASPNAVIEAMAAGLPVVASRMGGIPELITPGVTGELVPPGDATGLAECLMSLIERPAHRHALGSAARAHVARRYSFDRMVASFEELYLSLLESRGSVGPSIQGRAA